MDQILVDSGSSEGALQASPVDSLRGAQWRLDSPA